MEKIRTEVDVIFDELDDLWIWLDEYKKKRKEILAS